MRLIEALEIVNRANSEAQARRFFLACGFTPLHLRTLLQAHLQRAFRDAKVEVAVGVYGDLPGNLERAIAEQPEGVAVLVEWSDLDPRLGLRLLGGWAAATLPDILSSVQIALARLESVLDRVARLAPTALCLPTLPIVPAAFTAGWQASGFELELQRQAACLGSWAADHAKIRILNSQRLDRLSPLGSRLDVKSELQTGFPYSQAHADAIAEGLAQLLRPPVPKKGLITDLDDTLWRGILGEAGVDGVSWDLASHSQIHGVFQQFLDALAARGVLAGVASKNDPALVEQALQRPDLLISPSRLFPVQAQWGPKSQSVAAILQTWNVAPDSVVFVDDSPMELAEVGEAFPEMECILFPKDDPAAVLGMIEHLRDAFGKSELSEEDHLRGVSVRAAGALRKIVAGGYSLDDFLAQAGAEITFRVSRSPEDTRAFDLVNKTNQFNLNGRRYTQAEWRNHFRRPDAFLLTASYRDKFGPLGEIASALGVRKEDHVRIEAWVISCRAFARRIEHQVVRRLYERFDSAEILFEYAETPRNGPFREFLSVFGGPGPEFRLQRRLFEQSCPRLFHTVKEAGDE
jgi:FkbH-like protein